MNLYSVVFKIEQPDGADLYVGAGELVTVGHDPKFGDATVIDLPRRVAMELARAINRALS